MLGTQLQQPVDRVAQSGELAAQPLPRTPGRQVARRPCGIAVDHECRHLVRTKAVEPGHPVDAVSEDEPVPEAGVQERFGHDERGSTHAQKAQVLLFGAEHLGPHSGMDAISAHQDVRGDLHVRRAVDGDPHPAVITPYPGYRRPVADPHPAGGHVLERGEGGALHIGAQQAQDLPAGKPREPVVVEAGRRVSRGIDILGRLNMVGHRCEPRVKAIRSAASTPGPKKSIM